MMKIDKLSDTEREMMEVIWQLDKSVTSSELLKIFNEKKGKKWSAQTMSTFLTRIVDKGVLISNKEGRINFYESLISKEEYTQYEAENILNNLYKGSLKNFLSALYYKKDMSTDDIQEINNWFSEK